MMSTERNINDNLPTVCYDEKNKSSVKNSGSEQTDDGASEARKLSLVKPTSCAQQFETDEKGTQELSPSVPDFSPAFVKIPFEDIDLGDCCGEGSFGTVYKGCWVSQGRKDVAVKTLNRMDEEVRILSTLSHRNIIQFYGACCDKPNYCLVTEYAPYGSLYSFLASDKSDTLEFAQMLSWARDVALGMNYLHEEAPIQVVHRDLKSKNVLICQDFSLKICDFGASRVFDETTVMTITGTYPWMAPELIQGLPTSEMCDVYSFGVVLWELLTKEVPFKGLQGFQVAWNVVERKERPLIPTTCPKRLSDLMQQCWQADATMRPPFCDILVELNEMLTDEDLEKQTDSFVHTKPDWIVEVKSKLKDIRHQESELVAENGHAKQREEIMKQWAEKLENELKQKSLFNFQFTSRQQSFNCEFSGTSASATSNVREKINRMMFNSGLHRHSREEKLGKRLDGFSPSNGTSPLFGMPLSRQGSTSSMESSRSMSMHSDMAYDMSKVSIDSSPVAFMDSADGFPFPKSREQSQIPGISKMKLQKQMSASSEEFQYEGMKTSRESLANGNESDMKLVNEWEKASAKSSMNTMNESLEVKAGKITDFPRPGSAQEKMNIPSLDVLEKALKDIGIEKHTASSTANFANRLYCKLEEIIGRSRNTASPLSDDNDITPQNSIVPCKCHRLKKSPPITKHMPPFLAAQKPPIKLSPTKNMSTEDYTNINTARNRPRKPTTKNALIQTEEFERKMKDSSSQTATNGSRFTGNDVNGKKQIINYLHHVPCLEKVCVDATLSNGKDLVILNPLGDQRRKSPNENLSKSNLITRPEHRSPVRQVKMRNSVDVNLDASVSSSKDHMEASHDEHASASNDLTGQVHDNSINRQHKIRPINTLSKKVVPSTHMSPPKSLFLEHRNLPERSYSEHSRVPRHAAARQVYLSTRSSSASDEQGSIYEADDFTYIIRPNRKWHQ